MEVPSPDLRSRTPRSSHGPGEIGLRVVAVLGPSDEATTEVLRREGFAIDGATPETVERVASQLGAEALVIDADLPGAVAAVQRVRKHDGVISTLPVMLIGSPSGVLHTSLDAIDAGGDAFILRPIDPMDLASRLRALLELPAETAATGSHGLPPSLAPPPPRVPRGIASAGVLSPALTEVLRNAAVRAGGTEADLALPSVADDSIDELIPPELLEPLDAPLDTLAEEAMAYGTQQTPPPLHGAPRRRSSSSFASIHPRSAPTPTITPLSVGGEVRLTGALAVHGAGAVLGAAARSRASGLVVLRSHGAEYELALMSGHVLSLRSNRGEDDAGPRLARMGVIPREAARFAAVPLDAGVRGAAMLAARGYLNAEALSQALARSARELLFDLLRLTDVEWEMRPLETAAEIPLSPRAVDALLVLGARARIEPEDAVAALGGGEAMLYLRGELGAVTALPLTRTEREAASAARGVTVHTLVETYGADVMPAMLALGWLGQLRIEGGATESVVPTHPSAALTLERTRVRALVESAEARDFFALLGVSEWSARGAALDALDARRTELAGLKARHPDVEAWSTVTAAFEDVSAMLADPVAWERYTSALRSRLT